MGWKVVAANSLCTHTQTIAQLQEKDALIKQRDAQVRKKEEERESAQTELDDLLMVFGDLEEKVAKYKVCLSRPHLHAPYCSLPGVYKKIGGCGMGDDGSSHLAIGDAMTCLGCASLFGWS